jgi:cyclohexa-1,5-dienecarbonyl-CoA hydratase
MLHVREREGALRLVLERPPVNVLDADTITRMSAALGGGALSRARAVVLESALPGVFSAGVDVALHAPAEAPRMLALFHELVLRLDALELPVIVAVDGACLGGACELAALADFTLATPRSSFGQPEIDVGCFPPVAAALLPRRLGRRAAEIVLLGERLDASEAARIGLASRVVDDLDAAVAALVSTIAGKSRAVLAVARKALRVGEGRDFPQALARAEALYRDELLPLEDAAEGVRAFLEKRPPRWQGR